MKEPNKKCLHLSNKSEGKTDERIGVAVRRRQGAAGTWQEIQQRRVRKVMIPSHSEVTR